MTEFEKQMLGMMTEMHSGIRSIEDRLANVERDVADMKQQITDLQENSEITRAAVNYNGQRLDELVAELKDNRIIA